MLRHRSVASAAPRHPDRYEHKRLHMGGALVSGLAGVGVLAKIGAGWRVAGWPGECNDGVPVLTK
ncbi:hypothetical protein XbrCFBP1976_13445 [Xanthomonas bromi]|uniref:Uncharacterized protein n=1 Tax=Xanthomonas bromi TaxID=56449 RepID=A0ABX5BQL2_9XANT|nr:hypothetical protein XbrCFBP1976_13445 [Xanthomonas bromi]